MKYGTILLLEMCTTDRMGEKGPQAKAKKKPTVLVLEYMIQPYFLTTRMFRTRTPHNCTTKIRGQSKNSTKPNAIHDNPLFHLLCNLLVNRITEILDRAFTPPQYDRL